MQSDSVNNGKKISTSDMKSMFLLNIAHEIQTPVNAIIELSDIMLRGELDIEQRWNAENIKSAGKLIYGISRDMFEFSNSFTITKNIYNIQSLINDVYTILQTQLMYKAVRLVLHINPTVPEFFKGDALRIQQILLNIIGNIVKLTNTGIVNFTVDWNRDINNSVLIFKIEDTGTAVEPEYINKLFNSNEFRSMDIGFAISKNLIESMNGKISVDSKSGKGSIFTIKINQEVEKYTPVNDEVAENIMNRTYDNEKDYFENNIIMPDASALIIDDNQIRIQIFKNIMSLYKISTDTVSSGNQAADSLKKNHYDIIFIDYMMNDISGIDILKGIKSSANKTIRETPVIVLASDNSDDTIDILENTDMNDFLTKPLNMKKLDKILKKWIPAELQTVPENLSVKESGTLHDSTEQIIDIDKGMMFFSDSKKEYLDILNVIYNDGYKKISDIKDYIKNNQFDKYISEIHVLKSICSNIGAHSLTKITKAHEYAYSQNDFEFINHNFSILIKKYEQILNEIKNILSSEGITEKTDAKKDFSKKYNSIGIILMQTADYIDNFDAQSAKSELEKLLEFNNIDWIKKQVIKRAINMISDCCYQDVKNLAVAMAEGEKI